MENLPSYVLHDGGITQVVIHGNEIPLVKSLPLDAWPGFSKAFLVVYPYLEIGSGDKRQRWNKEEIFEFLDSLPENAKRFIQALANKGGKISFKQLKGLLNLDGKVLRGPLNSITVQTQKRGKEPLLKDDGGRPDRKLRWIKEEYLPLIQEWSSKSDVRKVKQARKAR